MLALKSVAINVKAHGPSLFCAGRVKTRQGKRGRSVPVATVKTIIVF